MTFSPYCPALTRPSSASMLAHLFNSVPVNQTLCYPAPLTNPISNFAFNKTNCVCFARTRRDSCGKH